MEADGFEFAKRVSEKSELPDRLKEFLEFKGPAFLEVMIDRDACVYPMVGPGVGYEEMLTGDFIRSREPVSEAKDDVDMTKMPERLLCAYDC